MAKLTQCPNGHFYDIERSPQCPYCGGQNTSDIPPVDEADTGKTAPLRDEAVDKTVPLQEEAMNKTQPLTDTGTDKTQPLTDTGTDKTQPLTDSGMGRTVPLADAGAPARQSNWQPGLLRIALGAAAFGGLLAAFESFRLLRSAKALELSFLWNQPWARGLLVDIICCAATCLCCVWCLRAKGARPAFPLSIGLAAADIGLALYGCSPFFRLASWYGLSKTIVTLRVSHALTEGATMLLSLIAAILAWAAIFLYQKKQKQDKIQ